VTGFRGDELKQYMNATTYSCTRNGFDEAMEVIRKKSEEAWVWLKEILVETWTPTIKLI